MRTIKSHPVESVPARKAPPLLSEHISKKQVLVFTHKSTQLSTDRHWTHDPFQIHSFISMSLQECLSRFTPIIVRTDWARISGLPFCFKLVLCSSWRTSMSCPSTCASHTRMLLALLGPTLTGDVFSSRQMAVSLFSCVLSVPSWSISRLVMVYRSDAIAAWSHSLLHLANCWVKALFLNDSHWSLYYWWRPAKALIRLFIATANVFLIYILPLIDSIKA